MLFLFHYTVLSLSFNLYYYPLSVVTLKVPYPTETILQLILQIIKTSGDSAAEGSGCDLV